MLIAFGQIEKQALKDRIVQIQTYMLICFLAHHLILASNSSKFVSSGGFFSAQAIASLSSAWDRKLNKLDKDYEEFWFICKAH